MQMAVLKITCKKQFLAPVSFGALYIHLCSLQYRNEQSGIAGSQFPETLSSQYLAVTRFTVSRGILSTAYRVTKCCGLNISFTVSLTSFSLICMSTNQGRCTLSR